ncbi:MAG: hypothetical protein Q9169_004272 [Polycauliona sp. 2 TL-2023]
MEAVGGAASILGILDVSVKIVQLCSKYISEVRGAQDEIRKLQSKVSALQGVMERLQSLPASEVDANAVKDCFDDLDLMKQKLKPKPGRSVLNRMGARSLKWPFSSKEVQDQIKAIEQYLLIFNTNLQLNISDRTTDAEQDRLLDKLAYVGDAILTSHRTSRRHRQCLQDTRVDVLRQIMEWTADTSPQCIFWLKGLAGTGKSTIATTVSSMLKTKSYPLATYFFERGHSDLSHVQKLIPTIVRQLARLSPAYCSFVLAAIKANPDVGSSADLREQFETLLVEPFRLIQPKTSADGPFIVVIDALDECDDEHDLRVLLNLFATTKELPKLRIKIFLSSRPDLSRHGFEEMPSILHYTMVLHDVPRAIVDSDIKIYLKHELGLIQQRFRLPAQWPTTEAHETLAAKAGGLFIFAATACRFIGGASHAKPQKRLQQICESTTINKLMTEELDQMYTLVLQNSIKGDYTEQEQESIEAQFRHVVGSIVILLDPLAISPLFELLEGPHVESRGELEATLETLHSVLDVREEPSRPVKPLHLSFRDFLVNPDRCSDGRFAVNEEQANQALASDCLRLLSSSLKRNMCGLTSLGTLRDEIDPALIERTFSPAVQYACRHWASHVLKCNFVLADDGPVHEFLKLHLLHWLECMGLIGRVSEAILALKNLLPMTEPSSLVRDLINDCHKFVVNFRHILELAPEQLYISALIFSPTQSIVRQNFASIAPEWIECNPPLHEKWPESQSIIETTYSIGCASFVSEDSLIATVSGPGFQGWMKFDLWDAQTCARQKIPIQAKEELRMIKIAPDGCTILLVFRNYTVGLWDIATRDFRYSLGGEYNSITCTAYSENSDMIAVGYDDGRIRLLETKIGGIRKEFNCGQENISALEISPDNRFIAISGFEDTVLLWNMDQSSLQFTVADPDFGYYDTFDKAMAFSRDGNSLAIALQGHVQIWNLAIGEDTLIVDVHTGERRRVPDGESHTLSPHGQLLAFVHEERNAILIWNIELEKEVISIIYRPEDLNDIVFSSDNAYLATQLTTGEVRIWRMQDGQCMSILNNDVKVQECSKPFRETTFSPNNELLACKFSGRINIWDIGAERLRCKIQTSTSVDDLVFAPNGRLLAFVPKFGPFVAVADTQTGDMILNVKYFSHTPRINFLAGVNAVFVDGMPHPIGSTKLTNAELAKCSHSFSTLQIEKSLEWVTRSSERILWLPPELRNREYKVWGNKIAIPSGSRLIFLTFADEFVYQQQVEEID